MGRGSITDAQRERVRQLHAEGKGRNVIAAAVGISTGSVTAIVREQTGPDGFDRAATATAVAARQLDLKDIRTQLERGLLEDAMHLRARIRAPYTLVELGSEGGEYKSLTWAEKALDEPLPADQLKLMQATAVAVAQSLKLTEANRETGLGEARSMLGQLQEDLQRAFREAQAEESAA